MQGKVRIVDFIGYKGVIENVFVPENVRPFFGDQDLYHQDRIKELATGKYNDLFKLKENDNSSLKPETLFELMQLGHPDSYGIAISRYDLLDEWTKRGKEAFISLGLPVDKDYPYVNIKTGYSSVRSLFGGMNRFGTSHKDNEWWSIAEHSRPIANMEKAIQIINQSIKEYEDKKKSLINPKTGKSFADKKDDYKKIEWEIDYLKESREIIEHYQKKKNKTYQPIIADNSAKSILSSDSESEFISSVSSMLSKGESLSMLQTEKKARELGITDLTTIKELTEVAIKQIVNSIALGKESVKARFGKIVNLYNRQPVISLRTSNSSILQQYSTPVPIGFIAGQFVLNGKENISVFEPSAGNGLLTCAFDPSYVIVNEIDTIRKKMLEKQGYKKVLSQDASKSFTSFEQIFDGIITNPPFGSSGQKIIYEDYTFSTLDHIMSLRALDTMKNNGRAALIIGGHTEWDSSGRIQAGKNRIFFNYLYNHYHVADCINVDGKLYSKQGTTFDIRLILITGRKLIPSGAAPLKSKRDTPVRTFQELYHRIMESISAKEALPSLQYLETALFLKISKGTTLAGPYYPASESCKILDTYVPDNMDFEIHSAIERITEAVGGDLNKFVMERLHYKTSQEMCKVLAAEQIDAIALAIYNIEYKGQAMIIGDQAGIGKGRVAASMIRYGYHQGLKPIFMTEKVNLFSDIYRDLKAIGSAHLKPFIVNAKESATDVKDEDGNIIYQALPLNEQQRIFEKGKLSADFDYVLCTYSQFNSQKTKPLKPSFLRSIAEDNIVIMDESHNASGSSNTGSFLQDILKQTRGITFLSATFAKRPDNMPLYALKTGISEANMTNEELISAIYNGGVALQEILASQLVEEGQMIRRERSYEGVEVNYISLDQLEEEHSETSDKITEIIRDIIAFQRDFIKPEIKEMDDIIKAKGEEIELRKGTQDVGVDNISYFSKVFNIINQMLFSIKAEAVADRAIERLKEGKKPVIAFASTMGSFLDDITREDGTPVDAGETINADFTEVLRRGLSGVLRYTVRKGNGSAEYKNFTIGELPPAGQNDYHKILEKIETASSGISISPIDIIAQKIKKAGYTVAEVTGRKFELQINPETQKALLLNRKKINTNDAFRKFNNNEVDVLMINQTGSTGASAHAIVTDKVPANKVKQRVMIVLQAEGNVNTEVQKRGRINRTGQILKPIYDYMSSAIPAEKRLAMMLQKKLKSLDANTTSNQKQSKAVFEVEDFLNKYGDEVIIDYLKENRTLNYLIGDPLGFDLPEDKDDRYSKSKRENAAHKVTGRVAILSVKMQRNFYTDISERYIRYVQYMKDAGYYDLEVEVLDLKTETLSKTILKVGKGGSSVFAGNSYLEKVSANVLRKPYTRKELIDAIDEALKGTNTISERIKVSADFLTFVNTKFQEELEEFESEYKAYISNVPYEKNILKLTGQAKDKAILDRIKELEHSKELQKDYAKKQHGNRINFLASVFHFFYVGKAVKYPVINSRKEDVKENLDAVFLGFAIDHTRKNPYAPSAVRLKFALPDSTRYIEIPASFSKDIQDIIDASKSLTLKDSDAIIKDWERITSESSKGRTQRFIITGNLIQAYSDYYGKLISYTTMSGEIQKGILLPFSWRPGEGGEQVSVPILRALPVIKTLTLGKSIKSATEDFAIKGYFSTRYEIHVPASAYAGSKYFKHPEILELVNGRNFTRKGKNMIAYLDLENLEAFAEILAKDFNMNLKLSKLQFSMIQDEIETVSEDLIKKSFSKLLELEARFAKTESIQGTLSGWDEAERHPEIKYIEL